MDACMVCVMVRWDFGLVFAMNTDGTGLATLHSFSGGTDGSSPYAGLLQGKDNRLYGTTAAGGDTNGDGTVFAVQTNGKNFTTLHTFDSTDGSTPTAALISGKDGRLYGTTQNGGASGQGTAFAIDPTGSGFVSIYSFSTTDCPQPNGLIQGSDGRLYGTAGGFFSGSDGIVFAMNTNGSSFALLHAFSGSDGLLPVAPVILGKDGKLYGITIDGGGVYFGGTLFTLSTDGTVFNTLYAFHENQTGPQGPGSGLLQTKSGDFYGAAGGGANADGVIYKCTTNGVVTVLHSFSGTDGSSPEGVVLGKDGKLYGAAAVGGSGGSGTLFSIDADGAGFSTIYNFSSSGVDGNWPITPLIQGSDGTLYGITIYGGTNGMGNVFAVSTSGIETTLHSFGGPDGSYPEAALIVGKDGRLYGTTTSGGKHNDGTVFAIKTDGNGFVTLRSFDITDGADPVASLIQGSDATLYGTTDGGGNMGGGTVFAMNPSGGAYVILHSFQFLADGSQPQAPVTLGSDGTLYGTTAIAPGYGGTVFSLHPNGTSSVLTTLHGFSQVFGTDGYFPVGAVTLGLDGNLYGATNVSGIQPISKYSPAGAIYDVEVNLPIISSFTPTNGAVGTMIVIKGANLAGATAVQFNGTAAAISGDTATQITVTVPAAATSGPITVVTPNGAGVSAKRFTVT